MAMRNEYDEENEAAMEATANIMRPARKILTLPTSSEILPKNIMKEARGMR
jgi:hypothetical protein